jgi:hypothetical protein
MGARGSDTQPQRGQLVREPCPQRGELRHHPVHVGVDARRELDHRRVRLGRCVRGELLRQPHEHLVARLRKRPGTRLEQH